MHLDTRSDTLILLEPGLVYFYSNPGFSMAGYVAERVMQAPFADLSERRPADDHGASTGPRRLEGRSLIGAHSGCSRGGPAPLTLCRAATTGMHKED